MSAAKSVFHEPSAFLAALLLGTSLCASAGIAQEAEKGGAQSEHCQAGREKADCKDADSTQEGGHDSGTTDTGLSSEEPDGAGAAAAGN